MSTSLQRTLHAPYDAVLAALSPALAAQGFGILSDIDVTATFRAKLGVDFRKTRILGACNPRFAHEALTRDISLALAMPCNVTVVENDDTTVTVRVADPVEVVGRIHSELAPLAQDARVRLAAALAALEG